MTALEFAVATDASALPYAPLTWRELIERQDDALTTLGIRAAFAIERDDQGFIGDRIYSGSSSPTSTELARAYREWQRASAVRNVRTAVTS